ncbi:MAG: response regulator transcription factor [Asticcacaulis sp.]|uniref:response regulator transcription factor n=1 Tax=Asticcacaulis sp. TaxID=1872648 RepID=UPI0039E71076
MRVLLVEDDPELADDLKCQFAAAGFIADLATDGEQAWYYGDVEDYDIAILDLGLPKLDGLSILRRWRSEGRAFPVLILTARSDWTEKVEGIEAGADDYLAKPFQLGELIARMRALIRRSAGLASPVISLGHMALDTNRMAVKIQGKAIRLSSLEYRLLDYLVHQVDRVVSATEIAEHLYGSGDRTDANTIEALIARVRRKIGAEKIETRRGLGYRLIGAHG